MASYNYNTTTYFPKPTGASSYADRLKEAMAMLEGQGAQQRVDAEMRYKQALGAGSQDLVSRGLTASSGLTNMRQGAMRDYSAELRRINEGLTNQKLGYYTQLSGEQAAAQQQNYWSALNYAMQQQQMNLRRQQMRQYARPRSTTYMPTYAQGYRPSYGLNASSVRAYRQLNG